MVADTVKAEKNNFAAQLADMSMKLAVVEDKLKGVCITLTSFV